MFDPNFDPLEQLEICQLRINYMESEINTLLENQSRLHLMLQELTKQNEQLTHLHIVESARVELMSTRIGNLEDEIKHLAT